MAKKPDSSSASKDAQRRAAERDLHQNRKALHDYFVLSRYEAGLSLLGTEVKSCRAGNIALNDAYVAIIKNEAWLLGARISPYSFGNHFNHTPVRDRRLLLHKNEIRKLAMAVKEKGLTIIPLRFYLSAGKIKLEIGLCKGKNAGDKRETLKEKQLDREARRDPDA